MADEEAPHSGVVAGSAQAWWAVDRQQLANDLRIDPENGLDPDRVVAMRERYGRHTIPAWGPTSTWKLLWESLTSPMMLLLLAIAGVALILGQFRTAIVMAFVVLTYVAVELINKRRTDRALAQLREIQTPRATVMRGGEPQSIPVDEVVVGDVLPLGPGSRVPADARLLSSAGLLVNEAPLTGESAPVAKDAGAHVARDAALAERPTAVFGGTTVIDGEGLGLVVAVGTRSELGHVAELSEEASQQRTPLQKEMDDLTRTLAYIALGVSFLIPAIGFARGFSLQEMILTWLALTFLMVPGQPPIIITMALALAAFELARKGVIVRRLVGAEALGSVDTLLSDKTGTMTENAMVLTHVLVGDATEIPVGDAEGERDRLTAFLRKAMPAIPEHSKDPTDAALLDAAEAAAVSVPPELGRLVDEAGFARSGSFRSLLYENEGRHLYVAGRPEALLERATEWFDGHETRPWDKGQQAALRERIEAYEAQGRRITAYAYRSPSPPGIEPQALCFAGCAVIDDPIRPEVAEALADLQRAGVRTAMVTGDSAATAQYVAKRVGLDAGEARTGSDLAQLSDEAWESAAESVDVFARTTPEQKLRLVEALQRRGETVAVTGDGVNDAPALRAAAMGIAMGTRGTDVARDAADLILTDDSLAHLPEGVAIGRKAYDNFRKGLTYYLSAKAILLTIFIVPLIVGVPFPFAPIQIIATELLMDLASSTIFITEAAEPDVVPRGPRRRTRFLSSKVALRILRNSAGLMLTLLGVYFGSRALGYDTTSARTAAWATWLLGHIWLALNLKQEHVPLFRQGLLANRFGAGWLAGMVVLVLLMTFVPAVGSVLDTTQLTGVQWAMVVAGALVASGWIEVRKWVG